MVTRTLKIDLFGGSGLGDFLPVHLSGETVVSRLFADRLRASGLTGLRLRSGVRVRVNQSEASRPKFALFDVVGRGGFCRRWRVVGTPNLCPYCAKAPIVCSGCGWSLPTFFACPSCGKRAHHGGGYEVEPDGQSLHFEGDRDVAIVEGREWDGSDFFRVDGVGGGWFVSQRARQWLEAAPTSDVALKPALLNREGVASPADTE